MADDLGTIMDLAGSLAILGMLAVAYGWIRRRLPNPAHAETLLGLLFGLVAVMQINTPLEPFDGMLVDMRNVPIVLAGAFLGLRGFFACILLAAGARLQIGGVGASAGIASMVISGGIGATWNAATLHRRRGFGTVAALGAATSLNMVAIVLLPPALALWYLTHAAPTFVALYFVSVTIVGSLLQRERQLMAEEVRLRESVRLDDDGFMPRAALAWAMVHSGTVGGLQGPVTCLALRLRHRGLLARLWGADVERTASGVLSERLLGLVPPGGVIGWAGPDLLLLSVPQLGPDALASMTAGIRRTVSDAQMSVAGAAPIRLTLDIDVRAYDGLPPLSEIVGDIGARRRVGAELANPRRFAPTGREPNPAAKAKRLPPSKRQDLFATFDKLQAARHAGF